MSDDNSQNIDSAEAASSKKKSIAGKILPVLAGIFLLVVLVVWWNYQIVHALFFGVSDPTPQVTLPTPVPTKTIQPTSTPTVPATQAPVSMPVSSGEITNLESLDPPIKVPGLKVIVLDDDTHVTPVPDFSSPLWIKSDDIARQMNIDLDNSYHATYGSYELMSATWQMDVPLEAGLYQIHVMDTLLSSGGTLDFVVKLSEREIFPYAGQRQVDYQASYSKPAQSADTWHSIGLYWLDSPELLSVAATWGQRDDYTIVAIDRVAIVHLPERSMRIIDQLPQGSLRYILDELEARIETRDFWTDLDEELAWAGNYKVIMNPSGDVKVTYDLIHTLPYGKYQVLVWIPKVNGNAQVSYTVLLDGGNFSDTAANEPRQISMGDYSDSQWVSLGIWEIPEIYKDTARLSLVMEASGEQSGEIPLDAAAFVKVE